VIMGCQMHFSKRTVSHNLLNIHTVVPIRGNTSGLRENGRLMEDKKVIVEQLWLTKVVRKSSLVQI